MKHFNMTQWRVLCPHNHLLETTTTTGDIRELSSYLGHWGTCTLDFQQPICSVNFRAAQSMAATLCGIASPSSPYYFQSFYIRQIINFHVVLCPLAPDPGDATANGQLYRPNSITLFWSKTGPKLVADLQRAGIWPII